MNHALATVELLELILLEIDTQTLLTSATRVCKFWNDVIQQSAQLQSALFFRPSIPARYKDDNNNNNKETQIATTNHIRTNSLLLCRFQDLLGSQQDPLGRNPAHNPLHDDTEKMSRPEASWRKMLIQQPPVRKLGIWRLDTSPALYQGFTSNTEVLRFGEDHEPLTMEALVTFANTLPEGYSWELFTGEERRERLEREKRTFFVIKSSMKEQQALEEMWSTSDMVVKLTRWLGGI